MTYLLTIADDLMTWQLTDDMANLQLKIDDIAAVVITVITALSRQLEWLG